jgi:hypothetical protein
VISPDAALAERPEACSACGAALDSLGRCDKCGAVFGEAYRCPLCAAVSDVEPSKALYYRCRTCGGPRIPPSERPISEAEAELLRLARAEQLRGGAFQAGAGFAAASGALSLMLTCVVLLVTAPGAFAKAAALLACVVPFALSFFAWRRAKTHTAALAEALQQAWLLAASRVVAGHAGDMSGAALAKALRVSEPRAELLLAELSVRDFVEQPAELLAKVRVTELAEPEALAAAAVDEATRSSASKP